MGLVVVVRLRHRTDIFRVIQYDYQEDEQGRERLVQVGESDTRGRLHELSSADIDSLAAAGVSNLLTTRRLICDDFPGDGNAQVIDNLGRRYAVIGEPRVRGISHAAKSVSVTLQQTGRG